MNEITSQALTPTSEAAKINDARIDLSGTIGELLARAAPLLGLTVPSLLQALIAVVGAAVGNAARMRTPITPGFLNLALDCVICEEAHGSLTRTLDFLLQPLRNFQDLRLRELGGRGRGSVEKEIAKLEAASVTSTSLEALESLASRLDKLRRSLRPYVLIEGPRRGELARAFQVSLDGALSVHYQGAASGDLLDAQNGHGAEDWQLLGNGFIGRSIYSQFLGTKAGPAVIQPSLACFIEGGSKLLGSLFSSEDPVISQFASQLIVLPSSPVALEIPAPSGMTADPIGRLGELVSEFLSWRDSGQEIIIELSPDAARILVEFSRQELNRGQSLPPSERRFTQNTAIIAAKIAGNFHLLSPQRRQPVSDKVLRQSMEQTLRLSTQTVKLAGLLTQAREQAHLTETADRMLEFLVEMDRTKPWPLWKRFDHHPKALMLRALELLIHTGRARNYPDGTVEAIL